MQRLDEESADRFHGEETDKNAAREKDDKDIDTNDVARRLPRDVNDLDRYTDQNDRSSLYDDYEAKDVAKRGVLGGPEDYEEEDEEEEEEMDESSNVMEDMAQVKEQGSLEDEGTMERRTARGDARIKRDHSVSETLDKSESSSNEPVKSNIAAEDPHSRQVSRIESQRGNRKEESAITGSASKGKRSNGLISDGSEIDRAASAATTASRRSELSDAEYEKRVEEEIQRKIDSIKEEIQRDIEAQRRINEIEGNNARFEELWDQERQDQAGGNSEREPIEKRQTVAKRSIRGEDNDRIVSSKRRSVKKRSLKMDRHAREPEHRDTLRDNVKKRAMANHDAVSSKGFLKKKRDRVRQTFLVNNDRHRAKKRHSRSYASPLDHRTAVRPANELFITDQDLNSHLHTDNAVVRSSERARKD